MFLDVTTTSLLEPFPATGLLHSFHYHSIINGDPLRVTVGTIKSYVLNNAENYTTVRPNTPSVTCE